MSFFTIHRNQWKPSETKFSLSLALIISVLHFHTSNCICISFTHRSVQWQYIVDVYCFKPKNWTSLCVSHCTSSGWRFLWPCQDLMWTGPVPSVITFINSSDVTPWLTTCEQISLPALYIHKQMEIYGSIVNLTWGRVDRIDALLTALTIKFHLTFLLTLLKECCHMWLRPPLNNNNTFYL